MKTKVFAGIAAIVLNICVLPSFIVMVSQQVLMTHTGMTSVNRAQYKELTTSPMRRSL